MLSGSITFPSPLSDWCLLSLLLSQGMQLGSILLQAASVCTLCGCLLCCSSDWWSSLIKTAVRRSRQLRGVGIQAVCGRIDLSCVRGGGGKELCSYCPTAPPPRSSHVYTTYLFSTLHRNSTVPTWTCLLFRVVVPVQKAQPHLSVEEGQKEGVQC